MKSLKLNLFLMLPLLMAENLHAQFKLYTPDDGLPQSSVYDIIQDRKGVLWISSGNGVARYDGSGFSRVMVPPDVKNSAPVGKMHLAQTGRVWIGGVPGLYSADNSNAVFSRMHDIVGVDKDQIMIQVYSDSNSVWFFDGKHQIHEINSANNKRKTISVKHLEMITEGILQWIPHANRIYCSTPRVLVVLDAAELKPVAVFEFRNRKISEIIRLTDSLWIIGMSGDKSVYFNPKTLKIKDSGFPELNQIKSICRGLKRDNELILVDYPNKIYRCKLVMNQIKNVEEISTRFNSEFGKFEISSLLIDHSNQLWVGFDGLGLVKINLSTDKFKTSSFGRKGAGLLKAPFIKSFCELQSGDFLVGTYKRGIHVFDRRLIYKYALSEKFPKLGKGISGPIFRDSKGVVWIAQANRIFKWIEKDNQIFESVITCSLEPTTEITAFSELENGILVCATTAGVLKFEKRTNNWNCLASRISWTLMLLADKEGRIWTSNYWGHLNIFRREAFFEAGKPEKSLFFALNARCVVYDNYRNVYVVGTEKGVKVLGSDLNILDEIDISDGMTDEFVYGILIDRSGNYWVSTNGGLQCINPITKKIIHFDKTDGLQSNEFNTGAYLKASNDYFLFGGINGFNYFDPETILKDYVTPKISLISAVFLHPSRGLKLTSPGSNGKLPIGFNAADINFVLPDYANPLAVRYYYKLSSNTDEWIYLGNKNRIVLSNLNYGNYELWVKGKDHNGRETMETLLLQFTVSPFYYQTWWFLTLIFLTAAILVFLITRFLFKQKLRIARAEMTRIAEIQNLRTSLSRELHDSLGANISRVKLLSQKLIAVETSTEEIKRINQLTNEMNSQVRDIVWSIDHTFDNLESLLSYIREYTITVLEENNIESTVKIENKNPDKKLNPKERQAIFNIIKESLNNTIKYSQCSLVEFSFEADENGSFQLIIKDNGNGFDEKNVKSFSNGLRNIKNRCKELGFFCELLTSPGEGTQWRFKGQFNIPLK